MAKWEIAEVPTRTTHSIVEDCCQLTSVMLEEETVHSEGSAKEKSVNEGRILAY